MNCARAPAPLLSRPLLLPRTRPACRTSMLRRASSVGATFADVAPSWEALTVQVAEACSAAGVQAFGIEAVCPDLANGPTSPHSLLRLFGTQGEPRVLLYRDHAAWCPYCEKVWLQLEEKRIPYRLEKVNMRCYGDKPASFLAKVPSGLLPALEFDGKLYTESAAIAALLEREFPQHTPLLPAAGTSARRSADVLLRLERELFGKWLNWLTSSWNDAGGRAGFESALSEVERALGASGGPYFLGAELSLVDITFAPFLERMAASLAYYKGMHLRGRGTWPRLEAWFDAMCARPTFHAIQSDYYTHAHDLPPQLGGCEFNAAGKAVAAAIDGTDGRSWHLPLGRLDGHSLEPYSRGDSPMSDRLEAAVKMIGNHEPVVRFAARGCGEVGKRPVSARLCDPSATPGEEYLPDVDAALRLVAQALITGAAQDGAAPLATQGGVQRRNEPVLVAAAYLRDRICVPRDLKFPAARQLRAHLNWLIDGLNGAT